MGVARTPAAPTSGTAGCPLGGTELRPPSARGLKSRHPRCETHDTQRTLRHSPPSLHFPVCKTIPAIAFWEQRLRHTTPHHTTPHSPSAQHGMARQGTGHHGMARHATPHHTTPQCTTPSLQALNLRQLLLNIAHFVAIGLDTVWNFSSQINGGLLDHRLRSLVLMTESR